MRDRRKLTQLAAVLVILAGSFIGGCGGGSAQTDRLREALYAGDQEAVIAALAAGADANGHDEEGIPFLLHAVYSEDVEATRALLEHGADPDLPGYDGTVLLTAVNTGDELALAVLDHGGTWSADEAAEVLAEAVQWAPQATERLLSEGLDPNATVEGGSHPLVLAAEVGSLESYRALRNAGSAADGAELVETAVSGNSQQLLAEVLADQPEASLPEGWFVRVTAMEADPVSWDWLRGLFDRHGPPSQSDLNLALASTASQVDTTSLQTLIDMGAASTDPDALANLIYGLESARDERGAESSASDFARCLDLLIGSGADVNGTEGYASALTTAAEQLEISATRALLSRGANPNGGASSDQEAPLLAALRVLVEASTDADEFEGRATQEAPRIVAELLAAGANPNVSTENGSTALHYAAAATAADTVSQLLDAGAETAQENAKGSTPADVARRVISATPGNASALADLAIEAAGLEEWLATRQANAEQILELLGEPIADG